MPIDPTGRNGPTAGQARGPKWRQTSHGLYVPSHVDASIPEQRVLEMSMLLPALGAVTGWGSLRQRGGGFFDGLDSDGVTELPVALSVGRGQRRRRRDGVGWLQDLLPQEEILVCRGLPCALAERSVFDEMRRSEDVRRAVRSIDMAAAAELTSISRVRRYADAHPGWLGVPLVYDALELASEDSWSPTETDLRLIWVLDARLPAPLVNQEIFNLDGRLLGIADLLDERSGFVAEYDGGEHAGAVQRSKDAGRDDRFRDHDLEVCRFTNADLHQRRASVERLCGGLRRAKWLPPERRTWTTQPPSGWEPRRTLDEELVMRDLRREEHERWIREGDPDIRSIRGF